MALLDVRGLVKWYGPRKVVDGVSFQVSAGEVVGLLGPNGAGKTTSFRMATGQVVPNAGEVWFDGKEVTHHAMYQRARLGMGYLSQEPSIFRKLTVEKNLLAILEALPRSRSLGRRLTRAERWERTDAALARFNLLQVRKNPAARCSGGEKRRLEIARSLVCEPLLILLDEPFAAVDPLTKEDIRQNIRELADSGIGILLTDHDVREVLKITDRSYLIKDGQVICHGTPEEIKRNPLAVSAYLGSTFDDELRAEIIRNSLDERRGSPPPKESRNQNPSAGINPAAHHLLDFDTQPPINIDPTRDDDDDPPPGPNEPPPPKERSAPPPPIRIAAEPLAGTVNEAPPPPPLAFHPPPAGQFSSAARSMLEQEKLRRLTDLFADDSRWQTAWYELSMKGLDAVPVLLEALERREVKVRHLAFRLLEQITGQSLTFDSNAPDDVRLRQAAQLRVRFEQRRAG